MNDKLIRYNPKTAVLLTHFSGKRTFCIEGEDKYLRKPLSPYRIHSITWLLNISIRLSSRLHLCKITRKWRQGAGKEWLFGFFTRSLSRNHSSRVSIERKRGWWSWSRARFCLLIFVYDNIPFSGCLVKTELVALISKIFQDSSSWNTCKFDLTVALYLALASQGTNCKNSPQRPQ